jgi:hypothetical protein
MGRKSKMTWAWGPWLSVALLVSACGDDGAGTDSGLPLDGAMGDALADTSAVTDAMADATPDAGTPSCTDEDLDHLLVVTTAADFSRTGVGVLALSDLATSVSPSDLPDTDSAAASAFCLGYVLSRGAGDVSVVDAADPPTVARTIDVDPAGSMGPYASNPQTIVATGPEKAYVVSQARNAITIIDPTASGPDAVLGEIDLSGYSKSEDMDGLVDAADAIVVGDRIYVALGHYWFDSSFAVHFEGSELAVIDATTDTPVDVDPDAEGIQGIDLDGDNPWRGLHYDPAGELLYVGATGDSFATDGQIEVVDLAAGEVIGVLVTEADLGAEINGFAFVSPTRVIVLAGTDLVAVDPTLEPVAPEVLATEIDGLFLHRDTLWAWARGGSDPGLASFDPVTGDETTPASARIAFGDLPILDVVAVP